MKNLILLAAAAVALPFNLLANEQIHGFTKDRSDDQYQLEKAFDEQINVQNVDEWIKFMSSNPHHTGSLFDREVVDFIADKYRGWGYDTEIVTYHVLMPTPKLRQLELIEPTKYTATLREEAVDGDPSTFQDGRLPTYNAFSPDGDVTAEVVFVNYGLREDYEDLERRGVSVEGKIVLAKYGNSWRGIKPKIAEEHGAIGALIYSDPQDDGYANGEIYPDGAWKHPSGTQLGSIVDLPVRPGDPLTPYIGATEDAKRLALDEVENFVSIPTLPISYQDALPILKAMKGPVAPPRWRGSLPITYHMGPGPAKVHLKVEFNWDVVPAYNVIATMRGLEYPDQWILHGNHHDAWVHGAEDPVSSLAIQMEQARIISELTKTGWRPKRTIKFAAWGAEEQGMIGSTEWVEDNAEELKEKLVLYINTDGNGAGFLSTGGSHTLETYFNQIAHDVEEPHHGGSMADRVRSRNLLSSNSVTRSRAQNSSHYYLYALGSGSDYTGFFQHLGIPSMNIGIAGESGGGSYHTGYDTYNFYTNFIDPDYVYAPVMAKLMGRAMLRMANADVLPFQIGNFARTVSEYASEMIANLDASRGNIANHNDRVEGNDYKKAWNIIKSFVSPNAKPEVPFIDLSPMQNAVARLQVSAAEFDNAYDVLSNNGFKISGNKKQQLDKLIYTLEGKLMREEGLPRRPWYRHHIYSPGFYTGYGVKTLPGVREAIEEAKWQEAQEQMAKLAEVLEGYADQVDQATALMK